MGADVIKKEETQKRITTLAAQIGSTWGFDVSFNTGKLKIFRRGRSDLAHLTFAWKTRSGEVDVHLTYDHETSAGNTRSKRYVPIFRMQSSDLETWGEAANEAAAKIVEASLRQVYKPYRPGWLGRNGYIVSVMQEHEVLAWLKGVVPKRRRKYRLDPERLTNLDKTMPDAFRENLYDPSILHLLPEMFDLDPLSHSQKIAVMAHYVRRGVGRVRKQIHLGYRLGPSGEIGWWGARNDAAARLNRQVLAQFFDWLLSQRTSERHELALEVVRGLGMHEGEDGERLVANVNRFFTTGVNPIRQPYPGMALG